MQLPAHELYVATITTTIIIILVFTVSVTLDLSPGEAKTIDSISATAVGLFLGGVVAGALGVLLIEGIVVGGCRLRRTKHK